jgi:archaellum biogenesis ATPase FlaH
MVWAGFFRKICAVGSVLLLTVSIKDFDTDLKFKVNESLIDFMECVRAEWYKSEIRDRSVRRRVMSGHLHFLSQ